MSTLSTIGAYTDRAKNQFQETASNFKDTGTVHGKDPDNKVGGTNGNYESKMDELAAQQKLAMMNQAKREYEKSLVEAESKSIKGAGDSIKGLA